MWDMIRLILAIILILLGVGFVVTAVFGLFRFKYVLNRMHSVATCDTMGMLCIMLGLMFLTGFQFATLKYLLVIFFFWLAGPVSSHLLSRLEVTTNEEIEKECGVERK